MTTAPSQLAHNTAHSSKIDCKTTTQDPDPDQRPCTMHHRSDPGLPDKNMTDYRRLRTRHNNTSGP